MARRALPLAQQCARERHLPVLQSIDSSAARYAFHEPVSQRPLYYSEDLPNKERRDTALST